ncbi:hypothetical protein H7K45_27745 [Mycobacterium yunnanensis]|uniref:Holin n=1 Tax=Mycobacterium yunnanensis TaxID=368477 RepID=A0A9X2ZA15_9MYCO|nr:hypothetical protein [Mycobacterium yunnanensis]MCV7424346.1 hypothetical protein [Mycobacterium yunnanensis]
MTTNTNVTRFGIRPEWREPLYRGVTGLVALLLALAYLSKEEAALWTQLGLASVTLLFAALFATSTVRKLLYPLLVAAGGLLTWYGWVNAEQWPLILAATAQMFGLSTAAAKAVQAPTGP